MTYWRPCCAPRTAPPASARRLNGLWRFRLDPAGEGRDAGWWRAPLADARDMPVPASYNDIFADAAVRDHVGDAWYQTTVRVPRGWAGQRIVLRFDAATHRAVVWVDDVEVAAARGRLHAVRGRRHRRTSRPGEEARVTVVVDNRLTWQSIPPGIVEDRTADADATSTTSSTTPGCTGRCGCTRTPPAHVSDVTVVTGLDGTTGTVDYRRRGRRRPAAVRVALRDADGRRGRRGRRRRRAS